MKNILLAVMCLTMAPNAFSEITSDAGTSSKNQLSITESLGVIRWVNNLCVRIRESGVPNEIVRPVTVAIETCDREDHKLRDYGKIVEAYEKLNTPLSCAKINLKEEELDTLCETSKGGLFKRVEVNGELGIQDLGRDGKIWFDGITKRVNQYKAISVCEDKSQSLPTEADFELAESRGIREAFNQDMNSKFFWSSTLYSDKGLHAYIFEGSYGRIHLYYRHSRDSNVSVRCVSAASVE